MTIRMVALAVAMVTLAAAGEPMLASTWQIVAQTPDASPRTARSGDTLWQQPLVVSQVAVLDSDAADPKGKVLLPSGSRLMKMASGDADVFCDLSPRKAGGAELFAIGSLGETAVCLVDRNHDGRFDAHFTKKVQYEGVPIIRGGYPADPEAIAAVPFAVSDGRSAASDYIVGVEFVGRGIADGPLNFRIVFGRPAKLGAVTSLVQVPGAHLPTTLTVLGSSVTLLSYGRAEGLHYRVDAPMPDQPFSVQRSLRIR